MNSNSSNTGWIYNAYLRRELMRIVTLVLITFSFTVQSQTVVTHLSPETAGDKRQDYEREVLRLALEKTRDQYGDYQLSPAPAMNTYRALQSIKDNTYPNFFIKASYEKRLQDEYNMDFVPFPVDLGIVGFRVCFTRQELVTPLSQITDLQQLKPYVHGQGSGWADSEILRHNGFDVREVANYEGLFKMAASGRIDLFCRGTNELYNEWLNFKSVPNLAYDTSISIAYPLPRFFYSHKSNSDVMKRIHEGVKKAFEDGSIQELWRENYKESIDFVKLDQRKIFRLQNPMVKHLTFDYEQYFYQPEAEAKSAMEPEADTTGEDVEELPE